MFRTLSALSAITCAVDAARPMDVIEHIVIFMQENRPYDHYFGTLKGVRGFNDRAALPLANGFNTFYQPIDDANLTEYMLPFRVDAKSTNAICMPAPCMGYTCDIDMYNRGRHDRWNTARDPGMVIARDLHLLFIEFSV
jgi:phospholipase C